MRNTLNEERIDSNKPHFNFDDAEFLAKKERRIRTYQRRALHGKPLFEDEHGKKTN